MNVLESECGDKNVMYHRTRGASLARGRRQGVSRVRRHVVGDQEEESALPLIKHYFTRQEMEQLVGKIMGKRPTELMQVRGQSPDRGASPRVKGFPVRRDPRGGHKCCQVFRLWVGVWITG